MASLKDVAKLAAVSLMTVSRAINHPEQLKPETYMRVKQAIDQLNYVPDLSARKIRGDRRVAPTIGVLALDTATTPFSVEILQSIEKTARQFNWNTFVVNLFNDTETESAIELLLSQRPDGIIFTTMGLRKIHLPEKLYGNNLVLANCITDDISVASYIPDDFTGQYQAMLELIHCGFKRPLCIYLPEDVLASQLRRKGLEKAWTETGNACADLIQYHLDYGDEHYIDTVSILKSHTNRGYPDFDVVVCGNDRIALLVYQYLLTQGLRIPQDISVLGYDNMVGIGDLFLPGLTTVELPHMAIGQEAALHLIEQRQENKTCLLPCPLLKRGSLKHLVL